MLKSQFDIVRRINKYPTCLPFAVKTADKGKVMKNYSATSLCCPFGFSSAYTVPCARGGSNLTLTDMNTWGYAGTMGSFLHYAGYKPTFEKAVSDQLGGYPKGTVLYDFSETFSESDSPYAVVKEVVSLQDNNTKNFVYDETSNPEPYEIGSEDESGVVWWDYIYKDYKYSLMAPNYSDKTLLVKLENVRNSTDGDITWTSQIDGWYNIEVTCEKAYAKADVNTDMVAENAVYHCGLTTSTDGWDKKIGKDVTAFRIYTNKLGYASSIVVPTNKNIVHQIRCLINDGESPLSISVYTLGIYHRLSE